MQQVIPVLHDQTGVDRCPDMLLQRGIGLRFLKGMELPVLEVTKAWSKPPPCQGEETKGMVAGYVDTRRTEAAGSAILPLRPT
jgi:hypothetical protein